MIPLAVAICLELFLIASIIFDSTLFGAVPAVLVGLVFFALWFVLPRAHPRRRETERSHGRRGLAADVAH